MVNITALLSGEPDKADGTRYSGDRPLVLVWNVTSRCNLDCVHCYSTSAFGDELSHEEALSAVDEFRRAGVKVLLFSGGEPLLREDVLELGKASSDSGIFPCLSTNGTLITKEFARGLKEAGFIYVGVSLDGLRGTHDEFRRREGAFREAMAGMERAAVEGMKVGVRFTVTKFNYHELYDLMDLADSLEVKRFCVYHLVYSGRAEPDHDLDLHRKRTLIEGLFRKARELLERDSQMQVLTVAGPFDGAFLYRKLAKEDPAGAKEALKALEAQGGESTGRKLLCVDPSGWVRPNQFWERRLGNIRERSLVDIISKDPTIDALRRLPEGLSGRCGRCAFKGVCGGFRARAEQVFGNFLAEDPACYLSEEEIGHVPRT